MLKNYGYNFAVICRTRLFDVSALLVSYAAAQATKSQVHYPG